MGTTALLSATFVGIAIGFLTRVALPGHHAVGTVLAGVLGAFGGAMSAATATRRPARGWGADDLP